LKPRYGGVYWSGNDAFPHSFVDTYKGVAGTYTRSSVDSERWVKDAFTF